MPLRFSVIYVGSVCSSCLVTWAQTVTCSVQPDSERTPTYIHMCVRQDCENGDGKVKLKMILSDHHLQAGKKFRSGYSCKVLDPSLNYLP